MSSAFDFLHLQVKTSGSPFKTTLQAKKRCMGSRWFCQTEILLAVYFWNGSVCFKGMLVGEEDY